MQSINSDNNNNLQTTSRTVKWEYDRIGNEISVKIFIVLLLWTNVNTRLYSFLCGAGVRAADVIGAL